MDIGLRSMGWSPQMIQPSTALAVHAKSDSQPRPWQTQGAYLIMLQALNNNLATTALFFEGPACWHRGYNVPLQRSVDNLVGVHSTQALDNDPKTTALFFGPGTYRIGSPLDLQSPIVMDPKAVFNVVAPLTIQNQPEHELTRMFTGGG